MPEAIRNFQQRVTTWFMALERKKKILYVAIALAVVFAISLLIFLLTRTEYVTLSRGLTTETAARVTNKLDELNISWRAEDNSTTIMVPKRDIDNARMQLSLSGVMSDRGFSFDDVMNRLSFTQTNAEKNRMFLEYTVSQIENSLRTIESIKDASVIVNVKGSSSFLNLEEELSSASVRLTIEPGRQLSKDSISGIENFVVNAVKGLTPEKVTIIDQTGVRLNASRDDEGFSHSSSQDELKVNIENRLDQTLIDFLGTLYGEENVNVKSNVTLDFDRENTSIIKFAPPVEGQSDGLVRSMSAIKESVADKGASGVPGTDSNTTETPQYPTDGNGKSDYNKSQETLNYELNKIQQSIVKAQGQISDLSIAIIINSKLLENNELTEANKAELINLVTAAAGVADPKYVKVTAMPFHEESVIPVTAKEEGVFGLPIWLLAAIGIGLIALLGLLAFLLFKRRRAVQEEPEAEPEDVELEAIDTESEDRSSPKYQIEKLIDSRPEIAAQLLRSWFDEI